jgi:F-type H+-transporting ATPase subunit alpha
MTVFAATNGFCDGYEVSSLNRYETDLSAFMRDKHGATLADLRERKIIDDAMKAKLSAALEEFRGVFRE